MSDGQRRSLVTGGAGFIGSHLVDALLVAGRPKVAVVDNLLPRRDDNLADALEPRPRSRRVLPGGRRGARRDARGRATRRAPTSCSTSPPRPCSTRSSTRRAPAGSTSTSPSRCASCSERAPSASWSTSRAPRCTARRSRCRWRGSPAARGDHVRRGQGRRRPRRRVLRADVRPRRRHRPTVQQLRTSPERRRLRGRDPASPCSESSPARHPSSRATACRPATSSS